MGADDVADYFLQVARSARPARGAHGQRGSEQGKGDAMGGK